MKRFLCSLTVFVFAGAALAAPGIERIAIHQAERDLVVTVTNLTRGQILSPPIVVAHDPAFRLFRVGDPASPELAAVAEDADNAPLLALLATRPEVQDVGVGAGPILPGESRTVAVTAGGRVPAVSVVGMLVTTNDAFYGASGFAAPVRLSPMALTAVAYDAGSEANTESCEHIPGPPCGNAGVRVTDGAEGFVHVHAGIHGTGDLSPSMHDWRNPVAQVSIRPAN